MKKKTKIFLEFDKEDLIIPFWWKPLLWFLPTYVSCDYGYKKDKSVAVYYKKVGGRIIITDTKEIKP